LASKNQKLANNSLFRANQLASLVALMQVLAVKSQAESDLRARQEVAGDLSVKPRDAYITGATADDEPRKWNEGVLNFK